MKCPNCQKENCLVNRYEKQFEYERKILKDGKVSKKVKLINDVSFSMPEWILCIECQTEFNYDLDNIGRICNLQKR